MLIIYMQKRDRYIFRRKLNIKYDIAMKEWKINLYIRGKKIQEEFDHDK